MCGAFPLPSSTGWQERSAGSLQSPEPANKGLRTDRRARFALPPAAEAQRVGPT